MNSTTLLPPATPADSLPVDSTASSLQQSDAPAVPDAALLAASLAFESSPFLPVPDEPPRAYAIFMKWALAEVPPALTDLADYNGVSRPSITRWKRIYSWKARRAAMLLHRLNCLERPHPGGCEPATDAPSQVEPASGSTPPNPDFRTEALSLARSALQRWQASDDAPLSLPGVTRVLELALKLTGQNKAIEPPSAADPTAVDSHAAPEQADETPNPAQPWRDPHCVNVGL